MKLRVAQLSDIHYSDKHLEEVGRCMEFAVESAIKESCGLAMITGDLFDHKLDAHSPALHHCLSQVERLLNVMPVVILQGTFSHDVPGTLDVFNTISRVYPLHVATRPSQVVLSLSYYPESTIFLCHENIINEQDIAIYTQSGPIAKVLLTLFPPVHKGDIAASSDINNVNDAAGEYVSKFMMASAAPNLKFRDLEYLSILASHGTVNGCTTEHGVPMHGNDHEFTVGSLFASEADAIMLGHIHKYQFWNKDGRTIAYAGSLGCLHYGEVDPKGFVIWEIEPGKSKPFLVQTPAKRLMDIEFEGEPDLDELAKKGKTAAGMHVRIRYCVDEDRRHLFDIKAIKLLFESAAEVKIEVSVSAIVRTRSQGITRKSSVHEKIDMWSKTVEVEDSMYLKDRLNLLMTHHPDVILEKILS